MIHLEIHQNFKLFFAKKITKVTSGDLQMYYKLQSMPYQVQWRSQTGRDNSKFSR